MHFCRSKKKERKEANEVNGNAKEEEWPRSTFLPSEGEDHEEHLMSVGESESLRSEHRKDEETDGDCPSFLPMERETEEKHVESLRESFPEEQE